MSVVNKDIFPYIRNEKDFRLKKNLHESNIDFHSYWGKKLLVELVKKHGLSPEESTVSPKKNEVRILGLTD